RRTGAVADDAGRARGGGGRGGGAKPGKRGGDCRVEQRIGGDPGTGASSIEFGAGFAGGVGAIAHQRAEQDRSAGFGAARTDAIPGDAGRSGACDFGGGGEQPGEGGGDPGAAWGTFEHPGSGGSGGGLGGRAGARTRLAAGERSGKDRFPG